MPEIIFSLPVPYLRYTRSVPCLRSSISRKFRMNPSSFRMFAILSFSWDEGMSTFSCSAPLALRMRVSMSAIGSVSIPRLLLPGGLDHSRNLAFEGQFPEADPAHLEFPQVSPRAAAQLAAAVRPHLELRGAQGLVPQRGLRHCLLPERHPQVREERLRLLVGPGAGHNDHVHPARLVDLVVNDLRKDHLFPQAKREVPPAIKCLR